MSASLAALRTTLASIWTWSVLGLSLLLALPFIAFLGIVAWPVDRINYFGGRFFRLAGTLPTRLTPRWRFEVRGVAPANPRHPYVVVCNHESFADILLLSRLPWEMKWLSKVEIMRLPVVGWGMWLVRDIGVKRGRGGSVREAMVVCADRLRNKVSVMIFPEGTRSPTRDLLPFKDGAFRLAVEAGVPILPLVLSGTRDAIARHDWRINPAHAVVEILEPEPTEGVTDIKALKERVQERIRVARDRLRAELHQ